MRALVIVVIATTALGTSRADADQQNNLVVVIPHPIRDANGSPLLGAGMSTGWRTSIDLQLHSYETENVVYGLRQRHALDASLLSEEVEFGYSIGRGKLLLFDSLIVRTRLLVLGGGGLAVSDDRLAGIGFIAGAFRIHFPCGFVVDLGVRETYAPFSTPAAAALGTTIEPTREHRLVTEVFTSIYFALPAT